MKAPNETLALGERIVRKLKVSSHGRTVSRWLCHYLAELLIAERCAIGEKRTEIRSSIDDTIRKIWSQRNDITDDISSLESLVRVIRNMCVIDEATQPNYGCNDNSEDAHA